MAESPRGRLRAFERRWLGAIATGLSPLPDEAGTAAPDPAAVFERMRDAGTPMARLGMRLALWLVAFSPLWSSARPVTVARLPASERSELLARLLSHRRFLVREAMAVLKMVVAFAVMGTPTVRAWSGYDRPPPPEVRGAALGNPDPPPGAEPAPTRTSG